MGKPHNNCNVLYVNWLLVMIYGNMFQNYSISLTDAAMHYVLRGKIWEAQVWNTNDIHHWIRYVKRKIIYQRHIFFKLEVFVLFERKTFLKKILSNVSNIDRYFCYWLVSLPVNCLLTGTCDILLTCKWKLFPGTIVLILHDMLV